LTPKSGVAERRFPLETLTEIGIGSVREAFFNNLLGRHAGESRHPGRC
jgi:hypothetical protein